MLSCVGNLEWDGSYRVAWFAENKRLTGQLKSMQITYDSHKTFKMSSRTSQHSCPDCVNWTRAWFTRLTVLGAISDKDDCFAYIFNPTCGSHGVCCRNVNKQLLQKWKQQNWFQLTQPSYFTARKKKLHNKLIVLKWIDWRSLLSGIWFAHAINQFCFLVPLSIIA